MGVGRGLGAAIVAAMVVLPAFACTGDDREGAPGAGAPAAVATPSVSPTLVIEGVPIPGISAPLLQIEGLFSEPVALTPVRMVALEPPREPSPFVNPPLTAGRTLLYDVASGEVSSFGPGLRGHFSPTGRYMSWLTAGSELRVLDLRTDRIHRLGFSWVAGVWVGAHSIYVYEGGVLEADRVVWNLLTDRARVAEFFPVDLPFRMDPQGELTLIRPRAGETLYRLMRGVRVVAEFDAAQATLVSESELLLATPVVEGSTNIFLVELASGKARFVGTAAAGGVAELPLSGNASHVAWVDRHCEGGSVVLFDRLTGEVTAYETMFESAVQIGADGVLAFSGEVNALFDPQTGRYVVALPPLSHPVEWSPDLAFAAAGVGASRFGCNEVAPVGDGPRVWLR